jgi:hypothetical protein
MTPAQWARVLGAGAGAANTMNDEASPATVLVTALLGMQAEARKIDREQT